MAGGGLQMAGRNRSFIAYLRLRALFVPLLTDCGGGGGLHNCGCKVLIGWSEIHHGNSVRELAVRSAHAPRLQGGDPGQISGSLRVRPGLWTHLCSCSISAIVKVLTVL